jgi:dienelactone hydrolase
MRHNLSIWLGLAVAGVLVLEGASLYLQLALPAPTGPHAVGRTTWRWVDNSRAEPLTPAPGDHHEVIAEVWYPAEAGRSPRAGYLADLGRVADAIVASGELSPLEVWALRYVRFEAWQDAPLAPDAAAYPVLILSPGNATNVEFYAALAGELASQGYVVVGLNHAYEVAAVALAGGKVAQYAAEFWPQDRAARQAYVSQRIAERTADVRLALDQLEALNARGADRWAGRLDLSRVGVWGHSLGGITAAQACLADARVGACLNLDGLQAGGPFSAEPNPSLPAQPFLFITKETVLPPATEALLSSSPATAAWVTVPGAAHDSFTDGPLLTPGLLPLPTTADAITAATRRHILAFFDQALQG